MLGNWMRRRAWEPIAAARCTECRVALLQERDNGGELNSCPGVEDGAKAVNYCRRPRQYGPRRQLQRPSRDSRRRNNLRDDPAMAGSARRSTVWVPGIQGPSRLLEVQGASTYKLDIAGLLLNSYELLFRCNAGGATQDGTRLFLLHFIVRRDGQLPAGATSCRSVRRKARCIPGEATTRQPTGCLGSREPRPDLARAASLPEPDV
ncbi:hypothetical protein ACCO45_002710 [Purpureocillium lilacinum]|uniref:Uncharacterized protein n=1 Tax=Purpureocillium lilacinum TaxID=33203 RepID=A0ACC4DZ48_PURLI